MIFKPFPGTRTEVDLLTGIAPIFRIDLDSRTAVLVGTGFWVTSVGHLVTAWHVVSENIGMTGIDRGPIFAVQTFADRSFTVRNFSKTDRHPDVDLALSETVALEPQPRPTEPIVMSLEPLSVGEDVFSFSVQASSQAIESERVSGVTTAVFTGTLEVPLVLSATPVEFAVRLSFGSVMEVFETMRDRVMLPFPCIQTDIPIYGGNSGGPVFDKRGRVRAVNCTSFGGAQVAFHVPVTSVLRLHARAASISFKGGGGKSLSVAELASAGKVRFEPPLLDGSKLVQGMLRWLLYASKCLLRGERPSKTIDVFVFETSQIRP